MIANDRASLAGLIGYNAVANELMRPAPAQERSEMLHTVTVLILGFAIPMTLVLVTLYLN